LARTALCRAARRRLSLLADDLRPQIHKLITTTESGAALGADTSQAPDRSLQMIDAVVTH
jgi:hypothetical protein